MRRYGLARTARTVLAGLVAGEDVSPALFGLSPAWGRERGSAPRTIHRGGQIKARISDGIREILSLAHRPTRQRARLDFGRADQPIPCPFERATMISGFTACRCSQVVRPGIHAYILTRNVGISCLDLSSHMSLLQHTIDGI
jgi:hypothetical protein